MAIPQILHLHSVGVQGLPFDVYVVLGGVSLFNFSHSGGCGGVSHCGVIRVSSSVAELGPSAYDRGPVGHLILWR